VGAWIAARRAGVRYSDLADALAPGLALAQAVGRIGNYFNQELYGRRTDLPWGLEIDPEHQPAGSLGDHVLTYHPTFLYELLWDVGVALLVIWADRRWKLTGGRAFALYAAAYTVGRFWIEALRVDDAHRFLGLRLNDWTSILVFAAAVGFLLWRRRRDPQRETGGTGPEDPDSPAAERTLTP
jgi:prolipoprotein diacylglyceryl transferase